MSDLVIDFMLFVGIIAIVYAEAKRGPITAIVEFAGVYGLMHLVNTIDAPISNNITILARPESNQAFFHITIFVILCVPLVFIAKFAGDVVAITLDTFDPIIGAGFGVCAAIVFCRAILEGILIGAVDGSVMEVAINSSFIGQEVLYFRTWHEFATRAEELGEYD